MRLKIPTGGRQTSWLFVNYLEFEPGSEKQLQLYSGQSGTSPRDYAASRGLLWDVWLRRHTHSSSDHKATYTLLTKRETCTGRVSARGLDSTDRAQRGLYKKDRGPIFSQYGPEQAWLIRDSLHD